MMSLDSTQTTVCTLFYLYPNWKLVYRLQFSNGTEFHKCFALKSSDSQVLFFLPCPHPLRHSLILSPILPVSSESKMAAKHLKDRKMKTKITKTACTTG